MENKIKIDVYGGIHDYKGAKAFFSTLNKNFETTYHEPEYSNATGQQEPLTFFINIKEQIMSFIGSYILEEAGKYFVKELILKPFFEKLEQFEDLNEDLNVGYFEFSFSDINIRVGYSRKNHINVVSFISIELLKRIPYLRSLNIGELNLIVTPVIFQNSNWLFWDNPPRETTFQSYTIFWGVEFNQMNRLVYNIKGNQFHSEYWWD